MAPKRGAQLNRRSTKNQRSVRKEPPHLNMPATIKVSIPLASSEREGVHVPIFRGSRPPLYTKHLDIATKVELANSVARQQLVKEEPHGFQVDNVVITNDTKVRGKRGRKKKAEVVSDFFHNRVFTDNNTAEVTITNKNLPKKNTPGKEAPSNTQSPPRKILTRKRLADSKAQEDTKRAKFEPTHTEVLLTKIKLEDNTNIFDSAVQPDFEHCMETRPEFEHLVETRPNFEHFVEIPPMVIEPTSTVAQPTPTVAQPTPTVAQITPTVLQSTPAVMQLQPKKTKSKVSSWKNLKLQPTARKPANRKPAPKKRGPKGKQQTAHPHVKPPLIVDLVAEPEVKPKQILQNLPGLVESRKNSVGSNSSKSWTRDISSSSNNTCVSPICSNDFVRINKKLPVLKLTNIDSEVKKRQNEALEAASAIVEESDDDLSDSCVSNSSDDRERKFSDQCHELLGDASVHLNSSSSSDFTHSHRKQSNSEYAKESNPDDAKESNKLTQGMAKAHLQIMTWISSKNKDVNVNTIKFRDKMIDLFDREYGLISHCRDFSGMIKEYIDDTCITEHAQDCDANENDGIENAPVKGNALFKRNTTVKQNTPPKGNSSGERNTKEVENDFIKPRKIPSRQLSSNSEGNVSNASTKNSGDGTSANETRAGTPQSHPSLPFYDHHDDDDTLSLFAESISGFECSRLNTSSLPAAVSKPSAVEEYVPQPVKKVVPPDTGKQSYCPTKISEYGQMIETKATVCEKQNADSTSIYKQSNSTDDAESFQDIIEDLYLDTRLVGPQDAIKPQLMESYFEGVPKVRSIVFSNLCFYHLMNCCRKYLNGQCRFVHLIPACEIIQEKLTGLDQRIFIQEYMLLRKWPELRRRYGMCYVEECVRRGLTRILVEMAYDFIIKAKNESAEDKRLRVETVEATLFHLNTVDLSICEDLLKLTVHSDQTTRTLLCDVLMATLSITQNFYRYKTVFLNLTYFMVDNDRTFNRDVVKHIFERVCILRFDEPVVRALIQMVRLTKTDIFNNSMTERFEKMISVSKDLFEEYSLLKNRCAFSSLLASSAVAAPAADAAPAPELQPPAASPDTTNLDTMQNKATDEPSKPIITRTLGMNPPIVFHRPATSPGDMQAHVSPGPSNAYISPSITNDQSYVNASTSRSHVSNTGSDSSDTKMGIWRDQLIFPNLHLPPPPIINQGLSHGPSNRGTPTRGFRTRGTTPRGSPMRGTPPRGIHMRGTPTRGIPTHGFTRPPPMRPQMRSFNQRLVKFTTLPNYANRPPPPGPKY